MNSYESLVLYCQDHNSNHLIGLNDETRDLLIEYCFRCLHQKIGYQQVAKDILQYFHRITILETHPECIVFNGDGNIMDPVSQLEQYGVACIQVYNIGEIKKLQKEFDQTLIDFPEYNRDPIDKNKDSVGNPLSYVLGGFSALGNPASFHNPLVRKIRKRARETLIQEFFRPLFQKKYKNSGDVKLEMLFDRMMFRPAGMKPVAESWHRDVMKNDNLHPDDEIYGGWLNLDLMNQYFSCIPGSHLGVKQYDLTPGFAVIGKDEIKQVSQHKVKFRVPVGCCVIFPQYILHEVVATANDYDMRRLFMGWRTTVKNTSIHGNNKLKAILNNQGVPPLPGGMIPPMYASNHGSFYLNRQFMPNPSNKQVKVNLIEWSNNTFPKEMLIENSSGNLIIPRRMKSLKEYGLQMYPEYTEEETKMYTPQPINDV